MDALPTRRDLLLVLAAMACFGLMPLFTREAAAPIVGVAAWRAVGCALAFAAASLAFEGRDVLVRPDGTTLRLGLWMGASLAVASSTFVGGYALTTVANTTFLHNLAPLAVFALAWRAFGERPTPPQLTGAVLGLLGVGMLSGVSLLNVGRHASGRFLAGDLLALVSAVAYAGVLVATRAARRAGTPILATLAVAWGLAAVILVVLAGATGEWSLPLDAWGWVVGLVLVSTVLPFFLLNLGMRRVGAGLAAVISLSEVLFAALVGLAFYGERLSPLGLAGGALVLAGVAYGALGRAAAQDEAVEGEALAAASRLPRGLRLAAAWLLLNAGGLLALLLGAPGGALLAWTALVLLARLGGPAAWALLGGQHGRAVGWAVAGVAGLALLGLVLRGGFGGPGHPAVVLVALAAWLADRELARREAEADRDPAPLARAALLLVAAAQLAWLVGHPAAPAVGVAAALAAGLGAWRALLAGARGRTPAAPVARDPAARVLDALPARPGTAGWALLAVLGWLGGGIRVVPPGHRAVVERLGRPLEAVVDAGLVVRLPPPIEHLRRVDAERLRRVALVDDDVPLLTGDQSMVTLGGVVTWEVVSPDRYLFQATDPEATLAATARAELIRAVLGRTVDEVLTTGRRELEVEVHRRAQAAADRLHLGIRIVEVTLSEVAVPPAVTAAFLDVISADEERQTRINEARAHAEDVLPRAGGEAAARLAAAHGEAARVLARAEGETARFRALRPTFRSASRVERERLRLEAWEEGLAGRRLVVLPPGVRAWVGDLPRTPLDPQPGRSR